MGSSVLPFQSQMRTVLSAAARGEVPAVGAERQAIDRPVIQLEAGPDFLARHRVTDMDGAILARRSDVPTVGAEGQAEPPGACRRISPTCFLESTSHTATGA